MRRPIIPKPAPLTAKTLREIQAAHRGEPDFRLLLLEIKRLRDVISEARRTHRVIEDAWRELKGGHLVAMHTQKVLLSDALDPD